MQNPVTFTPTEAVILTHRLEAPDAIAEALSDGGAPWTYAAIEERATAILSGWRGGKSLTVDMGDSLTRAIIEDCCDGSVFFAAMEYAVDYGEITPAKARHLEQAATTLEAKTGVPVPLG